MIQSSGLLPCMILLASWNLMNIMIMDRLVKLPMQTVLATSISMTQREMLLPPIFAGIYAVHTGIIPMDF